jgi:hypothetical protein
MQDAVIHSTPQERAAFGLGKLPERAAAFAAAGKPFRCLGKKYFRFVPDKWSREYARLNRTFGASAMPADLHKARELFLHAVGKLPAEEWASYVAQACGGDRELRQQVEHLLQVHREAGSFLERPAADLKATGVDGDRTVVQMAAGGPTEAPGTVLGPYQLVRLLGEGGMAKRAVAAEVRARQQSLAEAIEQLRALDTLETPADDKPGKNVGDSRPPSRERRREAWNSSTRSC